MKMEEILIELIRNKTEEYLFKRFNGETSEALSEYTARGLIDEGCFLPPCKIGQKVYEAWEDGSGDVEIFTHTVTEVCSTGFFVSAYNPPSDDMGDFFSYEEIGKTFFFSFEDAKNSVGGGENGKRHNHD